MSINSLIFFGDVEMSKLRSIHLVTILVALLIVIVAFLLFPIFVFSATLPDDTKLMVKTSTLQIPFVENNGQLKDKSVKFYASTFAGNVYVTDKGEVVYGFALRESLLGATSPSIKGEGKAAMKVNYFVGAKDNWKTGIPTWDSVSLGEVYEGVELKLKAYGRNIEKLFIVNECGDVEDIKVILEGADNLEVNSSGELEVETELGIVKFTKPFAYQEIDGKKIEVGCEFVIAKEQSDRGNLNNYGFHVASYNNNYPLVIDPLLASTFIGGSSSDYSRGITVDSSGNVYITAETGSVDYPATSGSYNNSMDPTVSPRNTDIVVSKLDSNLTTLLASTFIGGNNEDTPRAIKIDSSGKVFITGWTSSDNYPTSSNAFSKTINQFEDNFISCFDSNLSLLIASTYIGGHSNDYAFALAIDSSDNIYISGSTKSNDYPTTAGSYDSSFNDTPGPILGAGDSFVSKFNNSLSALLVSTYLGGNYIDEGRGIAVYDNGNVYVTGATSSTDFPSTAGAYDETRNGSDPFVVSVFISKFDSNLSTLIATTYIGNNCAPMGIVIEPSGNIVIAGFAYTYLGEYPVTPGAYDTTYSTTDAFVSKLNGDLSTLLASTFIGGSNSEYCYGLAVDSTGSIFISGETKSNDYPTTENAYDGTYNGQRDIFISKFNSSLSTLAASTYLGGDYDELPGVITIDIFGNIYVSGLSASVNYPVTAGAYDVSKNVGGDVIVSKLDNNLSSGTGIPTAITLSSLSANQKGKKVVIKWETATEIDNLGFNILRSESESGSYEKINGKLIKAKGSSTKGASYKFKDKNINAGKIYWYKLEDIASNASNGLNGPVKVEVTYRKRK